MGKAFLRRALPAIAAGVLTISSFSTAYAFDPQAKWCSGVKIAAFPGGPQGGVFANNVYNGFRQAELDLGPTVTYYFSNWDPNTMLTADPAGDRDQGRRHRHLWLRRRRRDRSAGRSGFQAGHHLHHAQHLAAQGAGNLCPAGLRLSSARRTMPPASRSAPKRPSAPSLQTGDKVFVWGLKGQGGDRGQRTVGVIDAFTKAGAKVIYQEIDAATNADPECRHRDLRRRDEGQSRHQDRGHRPWRPDLQRRRLCQGRLAEARPGAISPASTCRPTPPRR